MLSIHEKEKPLGVIAQFGGQTPLNLAADLKKNGVNILGTTPETIDLAEDRDHFRQDRNELRERIDKTESLVRELQEQVSENRREIDMMRPFLCGVLGCKLRKPVAISEAPSADKPKKQTKKKEA